MCPKTHSYSCGLDFIYETCVKECVFAYLFVNPQTGHYHPDKNFSKQSLKQDFMVSSLHQAEAASLKLDVVSKLCI